MLRTGGENGVHRQGTPAVRRGFALVLAILLMGLVLLLMVSLSALSRVGMADAAPRMAVLQARENARLGLLQALGELQRTAGADRRVTARAEILGVGQATAGSIYWTGVWDSSDPGQDPVWLVSGEAPNPAAPAADTVVLVPANPATGVPAVAVEKIYFEGGDGSRNAFAWWVGDEGVKASLAPGREVPAGLTPLEAAALANQTPAGTDLGGLLAAGAEADAVLVGALNKLAERSALPLLWDAGGPAVTEQRAQAAFYDYTPCAYGVLENPATGGLKVNLSDDAYRDGFVNDALQAFLTPVNAEPRADLTAPREKDGEPAHALYPVPTEVLLTMRVFHGWHDAEIHIRYHIEVEFWNPYSVPVFFPAERSTDGNYKNRAVAVYFDGMPEITVKDGSGQSEDVEDDLSDFGRDDYTGNKRYFHAWLDLEPKKNEDGQPEGPPVLLPGEVYRLRSPVPDQPEGLNRSLCFENRRLSESGQATWAVTDKERPEYDAKIRVKIAKPKNGVTIGFTAFTDGDADYRAQDAFFKVTHLDYEKLDEKQVFRSKTKPDQTANKNDVSYELKEYESHVKDGYLTFSLPESLKYTADQYTIAYHYKLRGDADELADLLTALDPRAPVLDCADTFTDRSGKTRRVSELVLADNLYRTDPDDAITAFDPDDLFHDPKDREHDEEGLRQVVAYDLPVAEPVSVGALRFARIPGLPALAIGSARAGSFNGIFDYYFMSPLAAADADRRLLNPWLAPADPAQWRRELAASDTPREDDAVRLCQAGAFNLNSTSLEAWRAVLGGSRQAVAETPADAGWAFASDEDAPPPAFFRLPFYGAWADHPYGAREDAADPALAFGRAGRTFSTEAGEAQLYYLCQGIVDKVKAHGPFATVADFANAGVLQAAIDEVGVRRGAGIPPLNAGVPEGSNLYLTQGDLLAALAPVLTVRSDTFVIRACGETTDPFSGEVARAWCEAMVRRVPAQADGSDPMAPTAEGGLGRRFELVSFRWLDVAEAEGEDVPLSL
ncbi:MAG: hypothetical protein Q7Q73_15225 [Verrucomicrobiota bacterium JB024]|nr:hypothetical protein [Verrucomicrobiota bacterium JB024]